jgi:hypothetical protein
VHRGARQNLEPLAGAPRAVADAAFIDALLRDAGESSFVARGPADRPANAVDGRLVEILDRLLRAPGIFEEGIRNGTFGFGDLARNSGLDVHGVSSARR